MKRFPELSKDEKPYLQDYSSFVDNFKDNVDVLNDHEITESAARRLYSPNQWPDKNLPGMLEFRPAIESYFGEMSNLAKKMFHLFLQVNKAKQ